MIVVSQDGSSFLLGHQLQVTGNCSYIVDPGTLNIPLPEKHRLMFRNPKCQWTVPDRTVRITRIVQSGEVMLVPGQSVSSAPLLSAEDVNRRRLLPEGALRCHRQGTSLWERDVW